jgi:hypothetical protein
MKTLKGTDLDYPMCGNRKIFRENYINWTDIIINKFMNELPDPPSRWIDLLMVLDQNNPIIAQIIYNTMVLM